MNNSFPLWLRIVVGVVAVLLIWWRISRRWDRASAYSDAIAGEENEQKKWYEQTKEDSRVQRFMQEVKGRYPIAEENMATADSYIIKYVAFYTDKAKIVAPGDSEATYIHTYIQGKDNLIVSKNLLTGEITESKVSKMSFDLSLPEWIKRKY